MTATGKLTFADLEQAAERRDPQFPEFVVSYLDQPDPAENAPEEPTAEPAPPLDSDAFTLDKLQAAVAESAMYGKSAEERWSSRREAWATIAAAPHPPPRLQLGDMVIAMYESGDEWSRASLMYIFKNATLSWGIWKGLKHIYKMSETRHDAEMFGVLAWRIDALFTTSVNGQEISRGTYKYMRRRAWRYLRHLGQAVPELYPQFAAQVLRHYPPSYNFYDSWVASQIWAHAHLVGESSSWFDGPPDDLEARAFDESWKVSPDPLLRLLEDATHDSVCSFAIRGLEADFPETLRKVEPAWLGRIGMKGLASVDEFVIRLLDASPELHQSRLAGLGLHEMVVGLLASDSETACKYAIDYCNAHAPDIPVDRLIEIAEQQAYRDDVQSFVRARLDKLGPRDIGMPFLIRMLEVSSLSELAAKKLQEGYRPGDLDAQTYVRLMTEGHGNFVTAFFKAHKQQVPAQFLRAHAEWPNLYDWTRRPIMNELGKRKAEEIGIDWIKEALFDRRFSNFVSQWLSRGMLSGSDLDVDWLKGLAMRPSQRQLGLQLLGDTKRVAPYRIGLDWLLALARHSDEQLSSFASTYLLQHFAPDDLALEMDSTDVEDGIEKIWSLFGQRQPAPVRRFAATYLKVHHPEIAPTMDETRDLGIEPKLARESYSLQRLRDLLFDHRADVRRFAADVAAVEMVRWNDANLVYLMAASTHREPRMAGGRSLLTAGDPEADVRLAAPIDWLTSGPVFALAESPVKASRELALTLIRRHYDRLGSVEKLAWLMDSADREVRLFAVRLLWDQHRPLPGPRGAEVQRFDSIEALQLFLRTILFGLPPGRMERRDGDALADRPLPSSVAKRRLIEVVRDMGVEDGEFAAVILPVLEEFLSSQAKGEWQACVAAIARMRASHPTLETSLPTGLTPTTPTTPTMEPQ